VAIAPLIIIWVHEPFLALLVCAWIVAFFPVVANTTVGLNSTDRNLLALFQLYGASRVQVLRYLKLPTALPYFLAGLRISGGLALIGAVVAEFVAGTGGAETGLAFRILEAGYRLAIPERAAAGQIQRKSRPFARQTRSPAGLCKLDQPVSRQIPIDGSTETARGINKTAPRYQ